MKIIYCGYWGTYSAYVMAAIHTGMYNRNKLPYPEVIERQRKMCIKYGEQFGNLIYMGLDESLNEIYILGCREYFDVIRMEYEGIKTIFRIDDKVWCVDCRPWDGYLCYIISMINKYNWLDKINKRLFLYWIKHIYEFCVQKVEKEKHKIAAGE